jgi:agmatinase
MAAPTGDPLRPRWGDNAFRSRDPRAPSYEATYAGALSFMRRPYSRDCTGADLVVWGIPFDAAVSNRPGTRFGPQAIRRASAIFEGDPQYPFQTDLFEHLGVIDYGDCVYDYGRPWEVFACIEAQAGDILASGAQLFSLGGDHSVTYPLLKAHARLHGPLALVQFDAHQDTWDDDGERVDHGSFVLRAVSEGLIDPARSIQIGIRTHAPTDCGIEIIYGDAIDDLGIAGVVARVLRRIGDSAAYLTFDIDALDPAHAPGTGTPVAGGLTTREAQGILRRIVRDGRFIGGDVVEVSPPYDHADLTAIAGAMVAQTYIGALGEARERARV